MQILFLFSLISLAGCSGGKIKFTSTQNDTRIIAADKDGKLRELGVAPISINHNEVFRGNNYVELLAQNASGQTQRILVSKPFMHTDIELFFDLKDNDGDRDVARVGESLEKVSLEVAKSYRLITSKKYTEAQTILNDLKNEFPGISVPYDFLGNIEYLKGNYSKALIFYQRAKAINPNNVERDLLMKRLRFKGKESL